ncbi:unnamed protein product, partial [Phaeothamnion confervicola]
HHFTISTFRENNMDSHHRKRRRSAPISVLLTLACGTRSVSAWAFLQRVVRLGERYDVRRVLLHAPRQSSMRPSGIAAATAESKAARRRPRLRIGVAPSSVEAPAMAANGDKLPLEKPKILHLGAAVEVWHEGRLCFGNFAGMVPGKRSLRVVLAPDDAGDEDGDGEARIDAGQVVAAWFPAETRDAAPSTQAEWQAVGEAATRLLTRLPARALDLEPLWKAVRARGKRCIVGSTDVAEHLFNTVWNPHAAAAAAAAAGATAGTTGTFSPSAAERVAAARLLASESARFKRIPTSFAPQTAEEKAAAATSTAANADEPLAAPVALLFGGFRALERSVVTSREVTSFCDAVRAAEAAAKSSADATAAALAAVAATATAAAPAAAPAAALFDPAHLLLLYGLELLALGGQPEAAGAEVLQALKALGRPATPAGAGDVLLAAGLWSKRRGGGGGVATGFGGDGGGGGSGDRETMQAGADAAAMATAGTAAPTRATAAAAAAAAEEESEQVVPFPAKALAAARETVAGRLRRARSYAKLPPAARVGAPAPFGRRDFRGARFGVFCVDGAGTRFPDDALSFDPETREVLVHVTDVAAAVAEGSVLDEVARLRGQTEYLPRGPLFMLPPVALEALAFSARIPNDAVTVALDIDPTSGVLRGSRVFLSLLPPVRLLTFEDAARHLDAPDASAGTAAPPARKGSISVGDGSDGGSGSAGGADAVAFGA